MAYPEVDFNENSKDSTASLFNKKFNKLKAFSNAFKTIIWVSYRNSFSPLIRYGNSNLKNLGELISIKETQI